MQYSWSPNVLAQHTASPSVYYFSIIQIILALYLLQDSSEV